MIVTEQKPIKEILEALKGYTKVFLIGCGECATVCKTGGEEEVVGIRKVLEEEGKTVLGLSVPGVPCIAGQIKMELAKSSKVLRETEAILVLACGLGTQSVKDNDRFNLAVFPACNTLFGAVVDAQGNFLEKCSLCGDCVLGINAGICPITRCSKGLLNGPCGGMDQGKCEVDKERDCAWVLIYKELEKKGQRDILKKIHPPRDFKKSIKPRRIEAGRQKNS